MTARPRMPNLTAITGWQSDRRRAVILLSHQEAIARRAGRLDEAGLYWSAAWDLDQLLRERATAVISESCDMHFADLFRWPHLQARAQA